MSAQCKSLKKAVLHREHGEAPVYLRCEKTDGHPGNTHRSWLKSWKDKDEDGWFEDDYEEVAS